MQRIRKNLIAHMPLYVLLGFYFLTTVLANLIYLTSWGRNWPAISMPDFSWQNFRVTFGFGYWALLLLPFFLVPPVALIARRLLKPKASIIAPFVADISKPTYLILSITLYSYVFFALSRSDALTKMVAAGTAMDAVRNRFELQKALGFGPRMVLLSLLTFLAMYACVKAVRTSQWFWRIALACYALVQIPCLILLNMKWPVVIFIIGLGLAVLTTARRFPILKSIGIMACGVIVYFLISTVVLRIVPVPTIEQPATQELHNVAPMPKVNFDSYGYIGKVAGAAATNITALSVVALNRMGMIVPFYYDTFTVEKAACGSFVDWALHTNGLKCRPSLMVYAKMFGNDGFAQRGTAPASFQIYEYAREGWFGAILALILGGIFIGAFLSLRDVAQGSDMIATIFAMGGLFAYFMTQLPLEAPLMYDHGVGWWGLIVAANSSLVWAIKLQQARKLPAATHSRQ